MRQFKILFIILLEVETTTYLAGGFFPMQPPAFWGDIGAVSARLNIDCSTLTQPVIFLQKVDRLLPKVEVEGWVYINYVVGR